MKLWLWALLLLGILLSSAVDGRQMGEDDDVDDDDDDHAETMGEDDDVDDDDDDHAETMGEDDDVDDDDDDHAETMDEDDDDIDDDYEDADDDGLDEETKTGPRPEGNDPIQNPCKNKICRRGETCIVDPDYRTRCVCHTNCVPGLPGDDRYEVCSKRNITYESECALDRDHCLCRRQLEGCSNPNFTKIRLDYFGPCQQLAPCTKREFEEFPRRTREWLFIIMTELADRREIPEYEDLVDLAGQEPTRSHAVLWKFCVLDVSPHDSMVSRRELLYTIQTLKPLEHCLMPFLDSCDADSDGQITLLEWGTCLGLESGKIRDVCKAVRREGDQDQQ
ncbi:SPARC-like isoform X2 [Babylonia areolata]|uniref:SPARC-like isoform X2 n=1 Tax=Babylonia areolata TaxID=304850 RepID=UPI003FD595B7